MRIAEKNIVSVFAPYWDIGNPYQDELSRHLAIHGVKVQKSPSLKTAFHRIIYRRDKPDILHLHWLPSFTGSVISLLRLIAFMTRLFILRIIGLRVVWTVHNLIPHEAKYPKIDLSIRKIVSRLSHVLIVHGDMAKKEIIATWHLKDGENIFVVPHGNYVGCYENKVDQTAARAQLAVPNSKIVILFLGGIRPYKGVLELIDTFKALRDERAHLVIAGRPLNEELTSAIRSKIQGYDNIEFVPGFVAEDQMQVYMNASDIVVFPYRTVLTSGSVVLAMSFGRPCIAPRVGCITDVLDDVGAFLYGPGEKGGLLWAMRCAIDRRDDLRCMGEHNRKLAERWDWNSVAEKTIKVYRSCLCR